MITNLFLYLTKSCVILTVFYLLYQLLFRRDTFFILHRVILLFGIFLSIIIPGTKYVLPFHAASAFLPLSYLSGRAEVISISSPDISLNGPDVAFSWNYFIVSAYLLGILFFLVRLIYELIKVSLLTNRSKISTREGIRIIQIKEDYLPFSLFRTIFYNPSKTTKEDFEKILVHEMAHIRQGHFIDVILAECLLIIQWFNPFMWLYTKIIKENHEYLADIAVTNIFSDKSMYQKLMVNLSIGYKSKRLTNNFHTALKKRILMITKSRTAPILRTKLFIFIPFIGILLLAFAQSPEFRAAISKIVTENQTYYQISGKVIEKGTQKPIPGAVVLVAESTNGCIANSKGIFTFLVPHLDIELVFSYINHLEFRKVIRNQKPVTIYLEPASKNNQSAGDIKSKDKYARVKWTNDTTYTISPPPFPPSTVLIVKGKIVQQNSEQPIVGGIISIEDQKSGLILDKSGEFSIRVPDLNRKLIFTYDGHHQEIEIDNHGFKTLKGSKDSLVIELKDIEL